MNGIICVGGKNRGCYPVDIIDVVGPPEGGAVEAERNGEGAAGDARPERERTATTEVPAVVTPSAAPDPPASYWPPPRVARSPNLVRIPAGTQPEKCSGKTCTAKIYKVKHPKTGKPTPAAVAETVTLAKDGVVVPTGAFAPYLDSAPGRSTIERDGMGYSHFIDCPDAQQFKRK